MGFKCERLLSKLVAKAVCEPALELPRLDGKTIIFCGASCVKNKVKTNWATDTLVYALEANQPPNYTPKYGEAGAW